MSMSFDDSATATSRLVAVARTGEPAGPVGRMRALALLQEKPAAQVGNLFRAILADRTEPPRARHAAAVGLYRMGGERARRALVAAACDADAQSAAPIATGLGRIGGPESLPVIEQLARIAKAHDRQRIDFSAILLAYRHGLTGHDVPVAPGSLQSRPKQGQPVMSWTAQDREVAHVLQALERDPFDAGLISGGATGIGCGPNRYVWLWAMVSSERNPGHRVNKRVLGALFSKNPINDAYSLALIGLATPDRGKEFLSLHRPRSGEMLYQGGFAANGAFSLRACAAPGVAAIDIRGSVDAGGLRFSSGRSAPTVYARKVPQRYRPKR